MDPKADHTSYENENKSTFVLFFGNPYLWDFNFLFTKNEPKQETKRRIICFFLIKKIKLFQHARAALFIHDSFIFFIHTHD